MKCIGGPLDGQDVQLERGRQEYGYQERAPLGAPCVMAAESAAKESLLVHSIQHVYTKRKIHLSGEREPLEFLAPRGWNDAKAIRHQFTK